MSRHEAQPNSITPIRLYADHDRNVSYLSFSQGQEEIPQKIGDAWAEHFASYGQHVEYLPYPLAPLWMPGRVAWTIDQYNMRQQQVR